MPPEENEEALSAGIIYNASWRIPLPKVSEGNAESEARPRGTARTAARLPKSAARVQ